MKQRVSIMKQSDGQNSYGEVRDVWDVMAIVWADVEPLRGRALFQASQTYSEVSYKITIRYQPGILPNMRILYKDKTFHIISVINIKEQNRYLEIMCKEVI